MNVAISITDATMRYSSFISFVANKGVISNFLLERQSLFIEAILDVL